MRVISLPTVGLGISVLMALACDQPQLGGEPRQASREEAPRRPTALPSSLVLAVPTFLAEAQIHGNFGPIAAYLSERVGVPTSVRLATDYAATTQLLATGEAQLASLPPFAYVRAKERLPELILLATEIVDGSPTYAGYIIARADSRFASLEALRGARFAFVERLSASGWLYPLALLRSHGIVPEEFFGSVMFAGDHSRVIELVLANRADAGAIYSTALDATKAESRAQLTIVAKTGRIPHNAYCAAPGLDSGLVERLRQALVELNTRTEAGRRVLHGSHPINGFIVAGDDHYDEVRLVARRLESGGAPVPLETDPLTVP